MAPLVSGISSEAAAREHIESIQRDYLGSSESVRANLAQALGLVKKSFERRGHFLLEFVQNAEDAGARRLKAVLRGGSLVVCNDGRPFSREDVVAICSIGRSSKDPREYLGYLGAGFKSVFLISSSPHVVSRPYRFKFDRDYWGQQGYDPGKVPWEITPVWLERVPEEVSGEAEAWNTCFLVPVDPPWIGTVRRELEGLDPHLLLFLRNLREVELSWDGGARVLRREGKPPRTREPFEEYVLVEGGGRVERWVVFRKVVEVPREVREDPVTREWGRDAVERREIAVAFMVDEKGDIAYLRQGGVKFGVFSYLPLREEEYKIWFLVHADFLVTPGREVMHQEAKWNKWLLDELYRFVVETIIPYFKSHPQWRYSIPRVFHGRAPGIVGDHLVKKLREELKRGDYIPDALGDHVSKDRAIKVDGKLLGLLGAELVEKLTGKRPVHPYAWLPEELVPKAEVRSALDLLKHVDESSVEQLARSPLGRKLLEALAKEWSALPESSKRIARDEYADRTWKWVLDEQGQTVPRSEVVYVAPESLEELAKKELPGRYRFLHPEQRTEPVLRYLREIGKVVELRPEDVRGEIEKKGIERLLEVFASPSASYRDKVDALEKLKRAYDEKILEDPKRLEGKVRVPTKSGKWLNPRRVLLSSEYEPEEDVERLVREGLLDWRDLEFLDPVFVNGASRAEVARWREFFEKLGVGERFRQERSRAIERIAVLVARRYEIEVCGVPASDVREVARSEERGYDIESKMLNGGTKFIEVKGSSEVEPGITLTSNQFLLLIEKPEQTFVYIVTNALRSPELHVVPGSSFKDALERGDITFRVEIPYGQWSEMEVKDQERDLPWKPFET